MTSKITLGSFLMLVLLMIGAPMISAVSAAPVNPPNQPVGASIGWNPTLALQGATMTATIGDAGNNCDTEGSGNYTGTLTVFRPDGSSTVTPLPTTPCGTYLTLLYPQTNQTGSYMAVFKGTDGYNLWSVSDGFSIFSGSCNPGGTTTVTQTVTRTTTLPAVTSTVTVTEIGIQTSVTQTQTQVVTSTQGPQNASYEILIYIPGSTYVPGSVQVTTSYPPSIQTIPYYSFGNDQQAFIVYGEGTPDQHSVTISWDSSSYTLQLPTSYKPDLGGVGINGSGWQGFEWTSHP